ncbi:putative Telomere length regulation protein-domain-containing protein [Seiridium unicorne]|uniref:Telomere length regulation protein-domain-containing protein n=1 Tax=Seiridium unicorne TaxID=138068 RepID=A0ABR2UEK3_9PEZI
MEDLLTPVSRVYRKIDHDAELLPVSVSAKPIVSPQPKFKSTSPDEALEVLKGQPDHEQLISVLKYLRHGSRGNHAFNVLRPSPQAAQIVHVLVTDIVPNYWTLLRDDSGDQSENSDSKLLLDSLGSVTGVNALLASLKTLLQQAKTDPNGLKQSHYVLNLGSVTDILDHLLRPRDQIKRIWHSAKASEDNPGKARALRQEFVSQIAGGKIVSLSAEAEILLQESGKHKGSFWLADGKEYVRWLGRNLIDWVLADHENDTIKICAELFTKSMKLGYADTLVQVLYDALILRDQKPSLFSHILDCMPQLDQRKVLTIILKLLASQLPEPSEESMEDYPLIWAATGVLSAVVGSNRVRRDHLVAWLTDANGAGLGENCGIRRAAIATIGENKETIIMVLEKSLAQFGDQLYIKHSPLLQQEAHAQVLLLSAGYVHRISPIKLTILLRTSSYLNAISNRIGASQQRAKFLGMVVGEALSSLVHGSEKKLDFHVDEMSTEEAKWYKSLVTISDKIGPINSLKVQESPGKSPRVTKSTIPMSKPSPRPLKPAPTSGFIIEEIEDDEEEADDDLAPYAKPDSDAEDSDDDPTLINRDKVKAPVYVRDLITYLRDVESYDRQKLALKTAPVLIRRKANYGTEVSSHAEELATLLIGLSDKYDLDDFHGQRLQGMVAVITAQPQKMGRWFAKTFFDGDYSLSQRASILIVLGLGGREIAGYEVSAHASASQFPSKQLPARTEKHYVVSQATDNYTSRLSELKPLPPNALDTISQALSQTFLAPLAAEAADAATGPDALKLSTFTSRLQDPSKVKPKSLTRKAGIRSIPNTTAQLIAASFFFPLTSRFLAALHSPSASMRGILFQADLLTVYLKTLALLLHAAGPSTLALPQMTSEFWDLLMGVRGQCVGDLGITHAVLFGLMALLDVNEADMRGLCQRHGREIVESVEWVSGVFDRTRGGDQGGDGEENQVKMMAAGILIRLKGAVERYRGLLMGELIGAP